MTASDFHTALQSPDQLGFEQVTALRALAEAYPWFGAGHILLAKAMHNTGDLGYDDQLHMAAAHAGSRAVLFDLVVAKELAEGKVEVPDREDDLVQVQEEVQVQEPFAGGVEDEVVRAEVAEPDLEDAPEPEPVVDASPEAEAVEEGIAEAPEVEVAEEAEEAVREKRPLDGLETDILAAGVSRVIEQEVGEALAAEEAPAADPEQAPFAEAPAEDLSPFAQWLLKRSSELGVEVDTGTTAEAAAPETADAAPEAPNEQGTRRKQHDLIDAFIAKDPHITPGRVAEFDPGDIARESIVEDESLVTETMARIYAKQGKLGKARKAYEMLALKYPEKSVYFANQLKKLDKKN